MPEPSDSVLLEWLRPTTTTLTSDGVAAYQHSIDSIVSDLSPVRCVDLIELACLAGSAEAQAWILGRAGSENGDIPLTDNSELLARLAASSAVRALTVADPIATLLGLLVQSATFVGLESCVQELSQFADAALKDAAVRSRKRPDPWDPIAGSVDQALDGPVEETDPETGEVRPIDPKAVAIRRLAKELDALALRTDEILLSIDEEYDALWWSYTNRSEESDQPWTEIEPLARRVVLIADEIGNHLTRVPSPPLVRGLMGSVLADEAATSITLLDLAAAAQQDGRYPGTTRALRLLPIESAVAEMRRLGPDGQDLVAQTLKNTLALDTSDTSTALDAASQLRREIEIGLLLD